MGDIYLDDLLDRRDRGIVSATRFLNEAQLSLAISELDRRGEDYELCGGHPEPTRARLVFAPYWEKDELDPARFVASVLISGGGYTPLFHRDFLGSLIGVGISRDFIGDIEVYDDNNRAIVFCTPEIRDFLLAAPPILERVGREKVKIAPYEYSEESFPQRERFTQSMVFVPSMRLDCVVSAICSMSRTTAKETVDGDLVMRNYLPDQKADSRVEEGDIITVRGKGKYKIDRIVGTTGKGNIRLSVLKYN